MTPTVVLPLLTLLCGCHSQDLSQNQLAHSQWSVHTAEGQANSGHCLLASGNFSLVVLGRNEDNTSMIEEANRTWVVPDSASAKGVCGELSSEINLHWPDQDTGEENLLKLVITKKGRLAALTGVSMRLHEDTAKLEMSVQMDFKDFITLAWPIRYGLGCPQSLQFPLFPAPISLPMTLTSTTGSSLESQPRPLAFLVVENLKLEAFRAETLLDQYPESMSQDFYRRRWACEFHMTLDWAPIAVGGGLACLVGFMLGAFLCKSSIGCGDGGRGKYDKF